MSDHLADEFGAADPAVLNLGATADTAGDTESMRLAFDPITDAGDAIATGEPDGSGDPGGAIDPGDDERPPPPTGPPDWR